MYDMSLMLSLVELCVQDPTFLYGLGITYFHFSAYQWYVFSWCYFEKWHIVLAVFSLPCVNVNRNVFFCYMQDLVGWIWGLVVHSMRTLRIRISEVW